MSIQLVQKQNVAGIQIQTSPVAFTSANKAGNLLVAAIRYQFGTPTFSDTNGNVWTTLAGISNGQFVQIGYALNSKAGANSVTSSGGGIAYGGIAEYSGVASFDSATLNTGTGTVPSVSISPSVVNELCIGILSLESQTVSAPSWTPEAGGAFGELYDTVASTASPQVCQATLGGSVSWSAAAACFKPQLPTQLPTVYQQFAFDSCHRADENPINPLAWSTRNGISQIQIRNNEGESTAGESLMAYTGTTFSGDQWAELQVDACRFVSPTGFDYASVIIVMRRQNMSNAYALEIDGPLGPQCNVQFFSAVQGAPGGGTFYFGDVFPFYAGGIARMECVGNQITAKLNGNVIFTPVIDNTFSAGEIAVDLFRVGKTNPGPDDAQFSNFRAGNIIKSRPLLLRAS